MHHRDAVPTCTSPAAGPRMCTCTAEFNCSLSFSQACAYKPQLSDAVRWLHFTWQVWVQGDDLSCAWPYPGQHIIMPVQGGATRCPGMCRAMRQRRRVVASSSACSRLCWCSGYAHTWRRAPPITNIARLRRAAAGLLHTEKMRVIN